MLIKKVIETEDGQVEFNANLAAVEVQYLLEFAINHFMRQGILPFAVKDDSQLASLQKPNGTIN